MALTYPVDLEARYDVWDTNTNSFVAQNREWPRYDGMEIEGMEDGLVPLLRVQAADPAFDPDTQRLGPVGDPVVDLVAQTSTYQRTVVDLTAEEIAARQEATDNQGEADLLKTIYKTFKDGNATNAQAQRAIAWLIKNVAGL